MDLVLETLEKYSIEGIVNLKIVLNELVGSDIIPSTTYYYNFNRLISEGKLKKIDRDAVEIIRNTQNNWLNLN